MLNVLVEVGVTKSLLKDGTITATAEDVRMTFHEVSIAAVVISTLMVDSGRVWSGLLADEGFRAPVYVTLVLAAVVLGAVVSVVLEPLLVSVAVAVITVDVCKAK